MNIYDDSSILSVRKTRASMSPEMSMLGRVSKSPIEIKCRKCGKNSGDTTYDVEGSWNWTCSSCEREEREVQKEKEEKEKNEREHRESQLSRYPYVCGGCGAKYSSASSLGIDERTCPKCGGNAFRDSRAYD